MPLKSRKQMRAMFAKHPKIAKRWVKEAKRAGKSPVQPTKRKKGE